MTKRLWLLPFLLLLIVPTTTAQDTMQSIITQLPPQAQIEGGKWVHQGTNRCSAAALTIQLSYFQEVSRDTYEQLANQELNTWAADASVRIEEMAQVARDRGLGAVVRRAGTVDLLRQLVANGFPVLVEMTYYDGGDLYRDWMSHNRVLIGYDDTTQTFYFQDPLLGFPDGQIVTYQYDEMETRWRPFNYDYLVIYNPQDEPKVQAILGEQWDMTANAQTALARAQAEIADGRGNLAFSHFNQGSAQLQLGMNNDAAASFDTARSIGLPMRMLWYEFGPFEAYIKVGRYEDARTLVIGQIQTAGPDISVEEWYYYAGLAYEGLGETGRAMLNYEVAFTRNENFTDARERWQQLQSG